MKINEKCIRCRQCIPYCPLAAIIHDEIKKLVYIDQDECVECGVCRNSRVCPAKAIYQPKLEWPRTLKAKWSSVVHVHEETSIQGRGTDEMKTLIQSRAKMEDLREQAIKDGMATLMQDGIRKVFNGETDLIQVRKVCIK